MPAKLFIEATRPEAAPTARTRQLVVPIGEWQHPKYGRMTVTPERARRFAESFERGVRTQSGKLPFLINHDDRRGAAGWITGLEADEQGVWADVEWTPLGREAIGTKAFTFISPEWSDVWRDPATGQVHRDVLAGASLIVRPFFKDLPEATLQAFSERTSPTVVFCDPEEFMDETAPTPTAPTAEAPAAAIPQPPAAEAAAEPEVTKVFAERQAALEDEVRQLRYAERRRAFADELGLMTFAERGHLAPVSRDSLADVLAELEPDQAKRVAEALGTLRFWEPGEVGLATPAAAPRPLTAEERIVAEQLKLAEEDMR